MKAEVKELLKEAYHSNDVCQQWKDKILKVCPELEVKKLEVGKWYKSKTGAIGYFKGYYSRSYGIHSDGGWVGCQQWFYVGEKNKWTPATDKEVETALIAEAKKRGFKGGCEAELINSKSIYKFNKKSNFEWINNKVLWLGNGVVGRDIFKYGKWAEIIKNPIHEQIEDLQRQLDALKGQL